MNLHRVIKSIVKVVNFIVPKRRNKVMFASFPDFADNSRALYEYMMSQGRFEGWSFVWEVSSNYDPKARKNTIFIKRPAGFWSKDYFVYLFHLFTSKYLFTTHSFFAEALPSRQISVLLWHGTMLKRICAMNEREKDQGGKNQYRFFISPSNFYVDYFCKSFLCSKDSVITCGYPRNDFLFEDTDVLDRLKIKKAAYNKIIVYMPTFRTPIGASYSDSFGTKQMCLDIESKDSMAELSDYLADRKTLLIVKWHPSDIRQSLSYEMSNIVFVRNQELTVIDAQVYHLLHFADALITDYSSVFCDYLLLDRPIAFDVSDIESYSDKRGFVFESPLDFMPGVKISNEVDFKAFCNDIAQGIDRSRIERNRLKNVYNDFSDDRNCQRLIDSIV